MASSEPKTGTEVDIGFAGNLGDGRGGILSIAEGAGAPANVAGVQRAHGLTYVLMLTEFLDGEPGYLRSLGYYCNVAERNRGIVAALNSDADNSREVCDMVIRELVDCLTEIIDSPGADFKRAPLPGGDWLMLTGVPPHRKPDRIGKWKSAEDINRAGGLVCG